MAKFKKGDRVKVLSVNEYDVNIGVQIGDTATVLENDELPFVRMNKYNENILNADGLCEWGHGYCFDEDQLELIEEETATQEEVTPKEKAVELIHKFRMYEFMICDLTGEVIKGYEEIHSKKCALIAVDMVVKELNKIPSKDLSDLQFWGEVEFEIKNL